MTDAESLAEVAAAFLAGATCGKCDEPAAWLAYCDSCGGAARVGACPAHQDRVALLAVALGPCPCGETLAWMPIPGAAS